MRKSRCLARLGIVVIIALAQTFVARAQEWVTFLECEILCDHRDTLTIRSNGDWTYGSENGGFPFGLCGGGVTAGLRYSCMDQNASFPSPASLGNNITNWSAEIAAGSGPRCPAVGRGSNPTSTVSVIEHTDDLVRVELRDDGDCDSRGRVEFRLRLRYFRPSAPVITAQPESVRKAAGEPAQLSVTATGGNLAYQWKQNGTNVPNARAATLNFPALRSTDAGLYSVSVTNSLGSVTSSAAQVIVIPPQQALDISSAPGVVTLSWFGRSGFIYRLFSADAISSNTTFTPLPGAYMGAGSEIQALQFSSKPQTIYQLEVDY